MKIAIIYDSLTGNTASAAQAMGKMLEAQGHECQIQTISQASPADVVEADLTCLGSWVKGLFIIRQHPTEGMIYFIEHLNNLTGKQVVLFCTYKIAIGSSLRQMAQPLQDKGAKVVGQFKFRGPQPNDKFASFVSEVLGAAIDT